ncbi:MAG: ABC-three component system protein [Pirellulales bacterium]
MNTDHKTLARMMFKLRVLTSVGQAYEDLFTEIMGYARPSFVQIKPQGQFGDRKNDGYVKDEGHYYQVYAPENPTADQSQQKTVTKLKTDFSGLKKHWQKTCPIKRFSFTFNDKYHGSFPTIEADLAAIKTKHDLLSCDCLLAKHLEDLMFSLSDDQIFTVLKGMPPDPTNITSINFTILREVIDEIIKKAQGPSIEGALNVPDFSDKIKFNGLSVATGALLVVGSYQAGEIDAYFARNSTFAKQQLRDHLNSIFATAKGSIPMADAKGVSHADLVFFKILADICPEKSRLHTDAALVVMAYFFESCDIFADPAQANSNMART